MGTTEVSKLTHSFEPEYWGRCFGSTHGVHWPDDAGTPRFCSTSWRTASAESVTEAPWLIRKPASMAPVSAACWYEARLDRIEPMSTAKAVQAIMTSSESTEMTRMAPRSLRRPLRRPSGQAIVRWSCRSRFTVPARFEMCGGDEESSVMVARAESWADVAA